MAHNIQSKNMIQLYELLGIVLYSGGKKSPVDKIFQKFFLESMSENKISSCPNNNQAMDSATEYFLADLNRCQLLWPAGVHGAVIWPRDRALIIPVVRQIFLRKAKARETGVYNRPKRERQPSNTVNLHRRFSVFLTSLLCIYFSSYVLEWSRRPIDLPRSGKTKNNIGIPKSLILMALNPKNSNPVQDYGLVSSVASKQTQIVGFKTKGYSESPGFSHDGLPVASSFFVESSLLGPSKRIFASNWPTLQPDTSSMLRQNTVEYTPSVNAERERRYYGATTLTMPELRTEQIATKRKSSHDTVTSPAKRHKQYPGDDTHRQSLPRLFEDGLNNTFPKQGTQSPQVWSFRGDSLESDLSEERTSSSPHVSHTRLEHLPSTAIEPLEGASDRSPGSPILGDRSSSLSPDGSQHTSLLPDEPVEEMPIRSPPNSLSREVSSTLPPLASPSIVSIDEARPCDPTRSLQSLFDSPASPPETSMQDPRPSLGDSELHDVPGVLSHPLPAAKFVEHETEAPLESMDGLGNPDQPSADVRVQGSPGQTDVLITPSQTIPDARPEMAAPEMTAPEMTAPEMIAPEMTTPEMTTPEITIPEMMTTDLPTTDMTTPIVHSYGLSEPAQTASDERSEKPLVAADTVITTVMPLLTNLATEPPAMSSSTGQDDQEVQGTSSYSFIPERSPFSVTQPVKEELYGAQASAAVTQNPRVPTRPTDNRLARYVRHPDVKPWDLQIDHAFDGFSSDIYLYDTYVGQCSVVEFFKFYSQESEEELEGSDILVFAATFGGKKRMKFNVKAGNERDWRFLKEEMDRFYKDTQKANPARMEFDIMVSLKDRG